VAGWPGGFFTREERGVVVFLAVSLTVGSLVMAARRVDPALVSAERPAPPQPLAGAPATPAGPVDVNAATAEELTALPGIGPARAAAIVALREERGGFRSLDELLDVKGIGPKTLARLRPLAAAGPRRPGRSAPEAGKGDGE
jgi:comEA protein